ncbi:MAG: TetR-like C-terminal domain-containing protein [Eubacteriales bacterium]|nr:TetR-like C-terminal domain-containing protein [Eubacteriales bacterium]
MKTDARVRYTTMRIKKAFFTCLAQKPVSKITVKEICDMAEINRATFYKHYEDTFDLLRKLEDEAIEGMKKSILACKKMTSQGILLMILKNIRDTGNSSAVLTSQNGDPGFAARISELFYQEFRPLIAKSLSGHTEDEQNAAYLFVAGGSGHLISAWINSGMRTPPEQVANDINAMCRAFVDAYARQYRKS